MARTMDINNLTPSDRQYFEQRPWLMADVERLHGVKYEDLVFGDEDLEEGEDGQANANLNLEQEVGVLRRQVAELKSANEELQTKLDTAQEALNEVSDDLEEDDEENDTDYSQWEYDELVAEIKDRNDKRENDEKKIHPESRKGPDLVEALENDDRLKAAGE